MIRISSKILDLMTGHAVAELPNECCGLLSGETDFIDGIKVCTNERVSRSEFSIPASELFEFFRRLREEERMFLGVYHSHPDGTQNPSKQDEGEFHYRDTSYWIVSLNNGLASVRCFEWEQMGFVEVPFAVREGSD